MKSIVTFILVFFVGLNSFATHLRGGYISIKRLATNSRVCRITVNVFTDTHSVVAFGGDNDLLDFGDGSTPIIVPETVGIELHDHIGFASFTIDHTYPGNGSYVVTYREPNRNAGVINMANSVNTPFTLKSTFVIDHAFPAYSSPDILNTPIFHGALGAEFSSGIATGDPNGFTLYYDIQTPLEAQNYVLPETFEVNAINGLITWDTKFQGAYTAGEYVFTVRIQSRSQDFIVGSVYLDFQIILEQTESNSEITENISQENNRVYVPTEQERSVKVFFTDPASAELSLDIHSEIKESLTLTTYDSIHEGDNILVGVITLPNVPGFTRTEPYVIVVRGKSQNGDEVFYSDQSILFFTEDVHKPEIILATESDEEDNFAVFPNPYTDQVTFHYRGKKEVRIVLYDMQGTKVYDQRIKEGSTLNLADLPGKTFVYQIVNDKGIVAGKLRKK